MDEAVHVHAGQKPALRAIAILKDGVILCKASQPFRYKEK